MTSYSELRKTVKPEILALLAEHILKPINIDRSNVVEYLQANPNTVFDSGIVEALVDLADYVLKSNECMDQNKQSRQLQPQ